jgi:hypothetical protein
MSKLIALSASYLAKANTLRGLSHGRKLIIMTSSVGRPQFALLRCGHIRSATHLQATCCVKINVHLSRSIFLLKSYWIFWPSFLLKLDIMEVLAHAREPTSSFSIVTRIQAGRPKSRGSISDRSKRFPPLHNVHTDSWFNPISCTMCPWVVSLGMKGRAWSWPLTSIQSRG